MMPGTDTPWEPYDPSWLVHLAREQMPGETSLPDALANCTTARKRTCCAPRVCGYHFVDCARPNEPGSPWQFDRNLMLDNEQTRERVAATWIILDILKDGRVGGIEFH